MSSLQVFHVHHHNFHSLADTQFLQMQSISNTYSVCIFHRQQCLFYSSLLWGRTFPSSPFSSPLSPFPPFRSPENRPHPLPSLRLEVGPVAARRSGGAYLGERISSPSGSSQNPAAKCILVHFMHIFAPLWLLTNENNFLFLLSIKMFPWCTCNSLLRQKKNIWSIPALKYGIWWLVLAFQCYRKKWKHCDINSHTHLRPAVNR